MGLGKKIKKRVGRKKLRQKGEVTLLSLLVGAKLILLGEGEGGNKIYPCIKAGA